MDVRQAKFGTVTVIGVSFFARDGASVGSSLPSVVVLGLSGVIKGPQVRRADQAAVENTGEVIQ